MARPVVWAERACERCGRTFRLKPCKLTKGQRFCSVACRSAALPPPVQTGNQYASKGDAAGRMAMHYRARQITKAVAVCHRCGAAAQVTHHVDENPRNNDPANLERLCRRCHIDHHRPQLIRAKRNQVA